ncbi:MAG: NADH-quinone oxidoreductase subunit NuoK [Candidatus Gastranaerophilales bacterium]|nr:NADH-quinone oxidoreductase subunit NuoK [Candidatus Gastranaerophilales bacterium]
MEGFLHIGLYHFMTIAIILFAMGILGLVISKNLLKILISVEIMFCGITLNLAALSVYCDITHFEGGMLALSIIMLASLLVAIGLVIALNIYKFKGTTDIDDIGELKG